MAGPFRFNVYFNRDLFWENIDQARLRPSSDDPYESSLRENGIRYVVEAPPSMALDDVSAAVRETVHPDFMVEPLFEDYDGSPVPERLRPFYLVTLKGVSFRDLTQSPYEPAYALLAQTSLISAEPDVPYLQFLADTAMAYQYGGPRAPADLAWSLRNISADLAWSLTPSAPGMKDGKGVTVAHLDTGWTDHVDLDNSNFDHARRMDFITHKGTAEDTLGYWGNPGHGTRTGSVIMSKGGVSPSGTTSPGRITGVAREATYVPVRCIKSVVIIFNAEVARAVRYATATSADVISMSLGGRPMKALQLAIEDAVNKDLLVVCAAGNNVRFVVWPARYPTTVAVAANNVHDQPWSGSSRGSRIDISAPGEDVWKADPDPRFVACSPGSGTSYATANLAGVAALWLAFHGKAVLQGIALAGHVRLQEVFRTALKATANHPAGWDTSKFGSGIVDAYRLLSTPPNGAYGAPNTDDSTHDAAGYESNDDGLMEGFKRAYFESFLPSRGVSFKEMVDAFGHELANAYLELRESGLDGLYPTDLLFEMFNGKHLHPERFSKTLYRALREKLN